MLPSGRRRRPRSWSPTSRRSGRLSAAARASVLLPQPDGILQLVTVPISIGLVQPEILGTVSVGFLLDNGLAAQLKEITGNDIAFGMEGQILAATLPREVYAALAGRLRTSGVSRLTLAGEDYLVLPRSLSVADTLDALPRGVGPVALILRSRTELLRGLQAIHTGLAATAIVAVLLATILAFAVARTITRPLANITDVMREVAATGDLTRKIAMRPGDRWEDEDARLLATTFNTLTDSIARFPARDIAERAPHVARPPFDRHRSRDPQSVDDHQSVAPYPAARGA